MFRENALDSICNETTDDRQELIADEETVRSRWGPHATIYLVCVPASTSGHKQRGVSGNKTYQPIFVLGVGIPNRGDQIREVSAVLFLIYLPTHPGRHERLRACESGINLLK